MKNRLLLGMSVVVVLLILGFIWFRKGVNKEPVVERPAPAEKIKISATHLPLYFAAKYIAGPLADTALILPAAANATDWQEYDLVFTTGTVFDEWVSPHRQKAEQEEQSPRFIAIAERITLLPTYQNEESGTVPPHDDPYFWLDAWRMMITASTIRDVLIEQEPDHKTQYWSNAAAFIEELTMIDRDIRERKRGFDNQYIVSEYPFLTYFNQSYGFTPLGVLATQVNGNYDRAQANRLARNMKNKGVKTIFASPSAPQWVAQFAADNAFELYVFDPIDYSTSTDTSYTAIMRRNIESLTQGFHYNPPDVK